MYTDESIVHEFVVESMDMIDQIEPKLVDISNASFSKQTDFDTIHTVFRLFHSMKGSAGFMNLGSIQKITHETETFLDLVRNGRVTLNNNHISLLFRICDLLRKVLDQVDSQMSDAGYENQVDEFIGELQALMDLTLDQERQAKPPAPAAPAKPQDANLDGLFEQARQGYATQTAATLQPPIPPAATKPAAPAKAQGMSSPTAALEESARAREAELLRQIINPEMVEHFLKESNELMDTAEQNLLSLEGDGKNQELVSSVFRNIHSFKGNCGMLGFSDLEKLSHKMETLLECIKDGELAPEKKNITLVLNLLDILRHGLDDIAQGGKGHINGLEALLGLVSEALPKKKDAQPKPSLDRGVKGFIQPETFQSQTPSAQPFVQPPISQAPAYQAPRPAPVPASTPAAPSAPAAAPRPTKRPPALAGPGPLPGRVSLKNPGLKGAVQPAIAPTPPSPAPAGIPGGMAPQGGEALPLPPLAAKRQSAPAAAQPTVAQPAVSQPVVAQSAANQPAVAPRPTPAATPAPVTPNAAPKPAPQAAPVPLAPNPQTPAMVPPAQPAGSAESAREKGPSLKPLAADLIREALNNRGETAPSDTTGTPGGLIRKDIRVDLEKLDVLIDLVGELIIAESMVTQNPDLFGYEFERFEKAAGHLAKITREIQDIAMSLRMVPLSTVFRKMIRLVHDLSQKSGKEVDLTLKGEDTEVDKTVIELISDPLVHMIRNAVDHGVEPMEERLAAGKPPKGNVTIEARHEGGEVWVIVRDDGRGMNKERILAKGIERGLVRGDGSDMKDDEIYRLVFEPGFSTADQVTDVSGRGVGMDVVKRNLERIKGRIDIQTLPGQGTRFVLRIPLTLAIIEGMLIRVGERRYIIPMTAIRESIQVKPEDITRTMDGQEIVMLRENLYPVVRLHEIHKITPIHTNLEDGLLMVMEHQGSLFCLFVDELIGQLQTVIKGLSGVLGMVRGVSGCAILGDGGVSLILDVGSLVDLASLKVDESQLA
ncbi:MAG: Hpt domain-containing protein [Deltaproteobacteria bacterium]|nr:Hpt domain-containing protein [Deltaproteobacteria bacterium]